MENFPESSSKGTKRRRDEDSDAGNTSSLGTQCPSPIYMLCFLNRFVDWTNLNHN